MNTEKTSTGKMRVYFRAQNIEFSAKRIFIDGLGGMAYGLFASLLIGTIISTVGTYLFDLRFIRADRPCGRRLCGRLLRPYGGLCRGLLTGEPLPGPCGAGVRCRQIESCGGVFL